MSRKIIELVQVLVDRIHQGGYTQRVLEDDIYAESQKRIAAEKDRDHWKQARQEAHEAGELMQAEIETLRKELADAKRAASDEFTERQVLTVEQQQDAAAWQQELDAARAEIETLQGAMAADDKRLRVFFDRVRAEAHQDPELYGPFARLVMEFNGGSMEPTPVTEPVPCPECERLRAFVEKARQTIGRTMNFCDVEFLLVELAKLDDAGTIKPTPVAETLDAEGVK